MNDTLFDRIKPNPGVASTEGYTTPKPLGPIDLHLETNEGAAPPQALLDSLAAIGPELLRRYPDAGPVETVLAQKLGVERERVLVTAGGDDALDRLCRAVLRPGREMILPVPSFEMFPHYASVNGATIVEVPWPEGEFPTEAVLAAVSSNTAMVVVVSPNNPTGAVASAEDLRRLSDQAPHTLIVADLAYAEFADADLTEFALRLPNVVVVRSLSKAWGLAGLRVGYAAGPAEVMNWLRAAGLPYAVSRPSLAIAAERLQRDEQAVTSFVDRIRLERESLYELLLELGAKPWPSQGNFVLARYDKPQWLWSALAALGIAVRWWPTRTELEGCVRITCPGDQTKFSRLESALRAVLRPQAILFDMDGVLADVSGSYRETILATAESFGVKITSDDVWAAKAAGNANNDWAVTRDFLSQRGVEVPLEAVTERFESIYQGTPERPGLRETEKLLAPRDFFERLSRSRPLAVVTGRPRADAERFLQEKGIAPLFSAVVTMEDGPLKPDPAPVKLALQRLGVAGAWMVGDTRDDLAAARAAGVVPVGMVAPGDDKESASPHLRKVGAAAVLEHLTELEDLLP